MIGEAVKGFSNVRWYCRAEIMMQIAMHFDKVPAFLNELVEREICDATTTRMLALYEDSEAELRLAFAAMLDMRPLVATTYELEGDRLEILVAYERIEVLRSLGRRLGEAGTLPNVDAVLRSSMEVKVGVEIDKFWPGHGICRGKVISTSRALTSIHNDQSLRPVWKVRYEVDNSTEELEEEEIRQLLVLAAIPVRACLLASLRLPSAASPLSHGP